MKQDLAHASGVSLAVHAVVGLGIFAIALAVMGMPNLREDFGITTKTCTASVPCAAISLPRLRAGESK